MSVAILSFMKMNLKPVLLAIAALSALGAAAHGEDIKVKVVTANGRSLDAKGQAVEVGRELKALDVIETNDRSSVDVMVFKDGAPGSIVRITPNSRMTVTSLNKVTKDDETTLNFEVSVQKMDATKTATIAAR